MHAKTQELSRERDNECPNSYKSMDSILSNSNWNNLFLSIPETLLTVSQPDPKKQFTNRVP